LSVEGAAHDLGNKVSCPLRPVVMSAESWSGFRPENMVGLAKDSPPRPKGTPLTDERAESGPGTVDPDTRTDSRDFTVTRQRLHALHRENSGPEFKVLSRRIVRTNTNTGLRYRHHHCWKWYGQ